MVVFFVLLKIKFGHGQNRYADVEKKPVSTSEYHYPSHASYNLGKNLTSNKILVTYTLVLTNTNGLKTIYKNQRLTFINKREIFYLFGHCSLWIR